MEMDTEKAGNGYGANLNVDTSTIQQSGVEETSSMMQAGFPTFLLHLIKALYIGFKHYDRNIYVLRIEQKSI